MTDTKSVKGDDREVCGIVMPISAIDGCAEGHWVDVKHILTEAIDAAGFKASLVSASDDSGIIQKRIVQNLYENPIVVCDVSGKNPNVMFELGMRLAFDKPTIIVKDDKTSYSFDTAVIEHVEYPRDLRFGRIVEFKRVLEEKIKATYHKSNNNAEYTTFLKHFGEFKIAKLDRREVSGEVYMIEELKAIRAYVEKLGASKVVRAVEDYSISDGALFGDEFLHSSVYKLDISERVKRALINSQIHSVKGILDLGELGLLELGNIGHKGVAEIKLCLSKRGVHLPAIG